MIEGKKIENAEGFEIYLVSDFDELDIRKLALIDALIVDYSEQEKALKVIRSIRQSMIEPIYLMPVFVLSLETKLTGAVVDLCDGIMSSIQNEILIPTIRKIKQTRANFITTEITNFDNKILTKVIRFMRTRDRDFSPSVDVLSHMGYDYALVSDHYKKEAKQQLFGVLEKGVKNEYFTASFIDTLHLCSTCNSTHLNLREVCPKCQSGNISSENLMHHFVCAHVAPESEFSQPDGLVCPKCNRRLRHIGVDYDKPSVIYSCADCYHRFQEPDMVAFCFSCSAVTPVENLKSVRVNKYYLTHIGKDVAENGVTIDEKIKEFIPEGFIAFQTFKTFIQYEVARIKSSQSVTTIGSIGLNLPVAVRSNPQLSEPIYSDIGEFIRNTTEATDILSFAHNSTYYMMLPNSEELGTREKLIGMEEMIRKLISNSITTSEDWDLTLRMESMDANSDFGTIISHLDQIG